VFPRGGILVLIGIVVYIGVAEPENAGQTVISANDATITEGMWFDDRFPMECDVCLTKITWKDLSKCNTWIENNTVTSIICPHCSGESSSV